MFKRFGIIVVLLFVESSLASAVSASDDNFGAIATSDTSGHWGLSYDNSTREDAERAALSQCNRGAEDCTLKAWFKNSCGAIAETQSQYGWGLGNSRAEAEEKAKAALGNEGAIVAWSCTTR